MKVEEEGVVREDEDEVVTVVGVVGEGVAEAVTGSGVEGVEVVVVENEVNEANEAVADLESQGVTRARLSR